MMQERRRDDVAPVLYYAVLCPRWLSPPTRGKGEGGTSAPPSFVGVATDQPQPCPSAPRRTPPSLPLFAVSDQRAEALLHRPSVLRPFAPSCRGEGGWLCPCAPPSLSALGRLACSFVGKKPSALSCFPLRSMHGRALGFCLPLSLRSPPLLVRSGVLRSEPSAFPTRHGARRGYAPRGSHSAFRLAVADGERGKIGGRAGTAEGQGWGWSVATARYRSQGRLFPLPPSLGWVGIAIGGFWVQPCTP